LHLLGVIEYQTKNPARAVELIGRALQLDPQNAVALCNLGAAQSELKEFGAALESYGRAIEIDAHHVSAFYNRANLFKDMKDYESALENYDRAIALKADFAEAFCNRGSVLQQLGRLDAALASYDRAIVLKPDYAEAHRNRGNVLHRMRQPQAALASCERSIELRSDFALAHSDRGVILHELGRFSEALSSCARAIALNPGDCKAHSNRGVVLHDFRLLEAALASFDEAIALAPGFAQAHLNKSLTCLLAGDFEQGWREHEWRLKTESGLRAIRHFAQPPWLGEESIAGKTILLYAERGLGDTIQFCRYVSLVAERGATVILEVQPPLKDLLSSLPGAAQVLGRGDALPAFDCHCSLLSLPLAFETMPATIPSQIPYVRANPARSVEWRERLGPRTRLRVGLVWSGGFRPGEPEQWSVNERRNIPLSKLAALNAPQIEFFSLQKGPDAEGELKDAIARSWNGPEISDWSALLADFSDTAAMIEHLDLVISVDTSTLHLAGAMGKPVWLLNRFDTCWRWLLERADSPWYPTLRIYRQASAGDWDGVVQRVKRDLEGLGHEPVT
jgi:tetratricopeptide (TPR) repeat protein